MFWIVLQLGAIHNVMKFDYDPISYLQSDQ